ncbi:hypothetical protein [Actinomycetospora cinnamomea]|uniref:Uncharacterized protein n=1 Tax=Actinomycetospora cinnamomea TaxID=663609 RepID=A0A2U1FAD2_9PSEU|nr:hypothetical protein [Actinomycetospora cinnamomea]PVZ09128.1 hypothetical protein C8D89_107292 [Actinomycetospora cinnamomea]
MSGFGPFDPTTAPYWWAHMWKEMREHQERVLTETHTQQAPKPTHPDYVDRDGDLWLYLPHCDRYMYTAKTGQFSTAAERDHVRHYWGNMVDRDNVRDFMDFWDRMLLTKQDLREHFGPLAEA